MIGFFRYGFTFDILRKGKKLFDHARFFQLEIRITIAMPKISPCKFNSFNNLTLPPSCDKGLVRSYPIILPASSNTKVLA